MKKKKNKSQAQSFSGLHLSPHPLSAPKKAAQRNQQYKAHCESATNKVPDGAGALRVLGPAHPSEELLYPGHGGSSSALKAICKARVHLKGIVCMQKRQIYKVKYEKQAFFFPP